MTVEQLWQPAPGGSGTYIVELARALVEAGEVELTGLAARRSGAPSADLPTEMAVHHAPLPRALLYESWLRRRGHGRRRDAASAAVLHATTWAVPPRRGPLVVTVHDLAFLRDPGHFTPRGNAFFRRALDVVRGEADVVVVPSQTTAEDCTEHGIEPERIRVVHHGVRIQEPQPGEVEEFRRRHRLERPYLLWCGTLEPRKNLAVLLDAYRALLDQDPDLDLDLVLVGPQGWGGAAADLARRSGTLPTGRLRLLGRLDEADLHRAYAGARTFCFPSTWEGFGMPVLEAMAHGVPVVTSAGTSMAEISTHGALLVDPTSPTDLAAALAEAAGEGHSRLAEAARTNAAGFTWARSAQLHVEAYRAAAASG
ncbi:glycosyltransferase family 4 protein [Actinotalea sp. BY-33]|uniref:Glycosyltransferase family 4 protein n=2 Tax=Actinotalea soli TaxID=2819234 RepID=A0A939RVB2_9CELL|nr:glycosyltransferase family 4 protein [Actinotalea soli]